MYEKLRGEQLLGYMRKSRQDIEREKKYGEDTLTEQRQLLHALAVKRGLNVEWYEEIKSGDKIADRPVFQEVMTLLESGEYRAIVVKEISRLGRGDMGDADKIFKLLERRNILIVTPYRIYDISNFADRRYIRVELFLAREEFETIRERLVTGRYNSAATGKYVIGHAPYGYRIDEKLRLEIDEEQARVIHQMVRWILDEDLGVCGVARRLNEMGVPSPGGYNGSHGAFWRASNIKRLLLHRVYLGEAIFRKSRYVAGERIEQPRENWIVVEDAHPAILTLDEYQEVERRLSKTKPRAKRNDINNPFAGLLFCSECGKAMVRKVYNQKYKDKTYTSVYLKCQTPKCATKWAKLDLVEDAVLEFLHWLKSDDESLLATLMESLQEKKKDLSNDQLIKTIEGKIDRLTRQVNSIHDKYEMGEYSKEFRDQRLDIVQRDLQEYQKKLETLQQASQTGIINTIVDYQEALGSMLDEYKKADSPAQKNTILRNLVDRIIYKRYSLDEKFTLKIYPRI